MITRPTRKICAAVFLLCAVMIAGPCFFRQSHATFAAKLSKTSLELMKGSSEKLKLKEAEGDVTWKSKDPSIATVSPQGVVTGVRKGTCTVIAKSDGKKYKCSVTVKSMSNVNMKGAMKGIDVSAWQGQINFAKVKKDGIHFVIMRAGHGYSVDSTFRRNYKEARKNGLLVGCYWFITATSKSALKSQARLCLKTIEGKKFDLPVFVDIESYSQFNKGKEFCSTLVDTFCRMVKKEGFQPGWYTSSSFVQPYLTDKVANGSGYVSWVAEHGKKLHYDAPCDLWQYSHTGRVKGIGTYVDLNWYFPNAREED